MDEHPRLLEIEEVLKDYLPVSRTTLYSEIRSGRLPVIKIGRRTLVSQADLVGYVDLLRKESAR